MCDHRIALAGIVFLSLFGCGDEGSSTSNSNDVNGIDGATFDPTSQWDVIVRDGTVSDQNSNGEA